MHDITYAQAVENSDALKKLGQTNIYLGHEDSVPWEFVTKVEPGGSHRLEIATSVWFTAEHPTGLTFSWSTDVEEREANGRGYYMMMPDKCRHIMDRLPTMARQQFRAYLSDCATKVLAKAAEWRAHVERQENDGRALAALAAV